MHKCQNPPRISDEILIIKAEVTNNAIESKNGTIMAGLLANIKKHPSYHEYQ